MWSALLLQVSLLVAPLHLGSEAPASRSLRVLSVPVQHANAADEAGERAKAHQFAAQMVAQLRAGADFDEVFAQAQRRWNGCGGGVLGTFDPGTLAPAVDQFLFQAAEFEFSEPIANETGFQICQRIDRWAGCRTIQVPGQGPAARKNAEELLGKLAAGADFAELARVNSVDAASAARGGALGIFERGPTDRLLKSAVFELKNGQIGGPIESPLGLHLVQRVDPASLDPRLAELNQVRLRSILIAFRGAKGVDPDLLRLHAEAEALAKDLVARIRAGEDMAKLAQQHDDDRGGRERGGDLGWIRRRSPQIPALLDRAFSLPVGEVQEPLGSEWGYLILRRER